MKTLVRRTALAAFIAAGSIALTAGGAAAKVWGWGA